ncbi:MAG: hypothetical protein AAGC63_03485 [Propionicimonas sp.]|nr:hypothetical protein [Propionicimonas sp.]
MSTLALQRGSEATWLQEQPVAPDLTIRTVASPDAIPTAGRPAIPDPEHVKRKPTTMTTTLSPKKETTTALAIPIALPPTSPSRVSVLIRRVRSFLASVPLEHELDTVNLRREITLHRLQLK